MKDISYTRSPPLILQACAVLLSAFLLDMYVDEVSLLTKVLPTNAVLRCIFLHYSVVHNHHTQLHNENKQRGHETARTQHNYNYNYNYPQVSGQHRSRGGRDPRQLRPARGRGAVARQLRDAAQAAAAVEQQLAGSWRGGDGGRGQPEVEHRDHAAQEDVSRWVDRQ